MKVIKSKTTIEFNDDENGIIEMFQSFLQEMKCIARCEDADDLWDTIDNLESELDSLMDYTND